MPMAVFRNRYVDMLYDAVEAPGGLERYRQGPIDVSDGMILSTSIDVEQPASLVIPPAEERAATDVENAIRLYDWLPMLNEVQASDRRLWVYLTHCVYHEYSRARWPIPVAHEKACRSVRDHWFVNGSGLAALRRNTLARLWWAARLTKAPWDWDVSFRGFTNDDPWAYLRVLVGNQDVYQGLVERKYGSSRAILIAMLDVIQRDPVQRSSSGFATWFAKEINLMCSFRELTVLTPIQLRDLFLELAELYRPDGSRSDGG